MPDKQSTASSPTKRQSVLGLWGGSISSQRCSALDCILYENAWLQSGSAKPSRFWSGFNRWPKTDPQRSRGFGFAAYARWSSARAGGWNRIVLVQDLSAQIAHVKNQGVHFRNKMEVGPGGRQIQVEDPDDNLIELFEPAVL